MALRVENLPLPVDPTLYQEAIEAYLERSHRHIEALYTFGTTHYPGLSDLDILVVPKGDYLAPLHLHLKGRLPRRFDAIIEHEAFIVPRSQTRACRYLGWADLRLAHGPDVLGGVVTDISRTAILCETLEFVHNKLVFLANLRRTGLLNAASCIRLFNSQRYNVRRLAQLGLAQENGYGDTIDMLRTQLLVSPSEDLVVEMYRTFEKAMTACARALQSRFDLDLSSPGQVAAVTQGRVAVPFEGYRLADARERAADLASYLQELVRRNYWYGFPFLTRLFPAPVRNSALEQALYRSLRSGARRLRRLRPPQDSIPARPRAGSPSHASEFYGLSARADPLG
jgi:hypothetical protein